MKLAAAIVLLFALASITSARPVGLRSLLTAEKDPVYCTGVEHGKEECPEHYECAALDKKVCKQVQDCTKDKYNVETCTYKQQCWEYACVEIPKYCEVSYDKEDECVTKYGKDLECKKLDKPECVYEKECKFVDTKECKEYKIEKECDYVDTEVCLKYNQVQKCEKDTKVCKAYKQRKVCKPAQKGKCTKYYNGECTEYAKGEEECEYVDTDVCKTYSTVKGECKYVNTTCKEYKQEQKCEDVKKGCKVYKQEEVCEDVKVCWTAKCVEVPKPKKGGSSYSGGR